MPQGDYCRVVGLKIVFVIFSRTNPLHANVPVCLRNPQGMVDATRLQGLLTERQSQIDVTMSDKLSVSGA